MRSGRGVILGCVSVPRLQELERNMELSSGSFQRQLTTERKKTHEVREEVRTLQDELDRVTQKLKVCFFRGTGIETTILRQSTFLYFLLRLGVSGEGEGTQHQEHLCQPNGEGNAQEGHGQRGEEER